MNAQRRAAREAIEAGPADLLTVPLVVEEERRLDTLRHKPRTWLLHRYRDRCRELRRSSIGRMFAEWTPAELAKAIIVLDRPAPAAPPAEFNNGGTYRFE